MQSCNATDTGGQGEALKLSATQLMLVLGGSGVLSFVVNGAAIWYIHKGNRGQIISPSLLNICLSSFLITLRDIMKVLRDETGTISLSTPILCYAFSLSGWVLHKVPSFCIIASFHEASKSRPTGNWKTWVTILLFPWLLAILVSLPSLGTYKFDPSAKPECRKKILFDSNLVHGAYFITSFAMNTLLPPTYILMVLRRMKFRLTWLFFFRATQPNPNISLRLIRRIRWAFFYLVSVGFIWMLPGLLWLVLATSGFKDWLKPICNYRLRGWVLVAECVFIARLVLHAPFFLYACHQLKFLASMCRIPILSCIFQYCSGTGTASKYRLRTSDSRTNGFSPQIRVNGFSH